MSISRGHVTSEVAHEHVPRHCAEYELFYRGASLSALGPEIPSRQIHFETGSGLFPGLSAKDLLLPMEYRGARQRWVLRLWSGIPMHSPSAVRSFRSSPAGRGRGSPVRSKESQTADPYGRHGLQPFCPVPQPKEFHNVLSSYRSWNGDPFSKAKIVARPTAARLSGPFGEEPVFKLPVDVSYERTIVQAHGRRFGIGTFDRRRRFEIRPHGRRSGHNLRHHWVPNRQTPTGRRSSSARIARSDDT